MKEKMSKTQRFAAWKAEQRKKDQARADQNLAALLRSGELKGSKPGFGRGMRKWAEGIEKKTT